jgi:hypothetical protein
LKSEKLQNETVPENGLSVKQRRAVLAVIESSSMEAAAKKSGCDRSTLYRWLELPAFRAELRRVQDAAFSEALMRLAATARKAVEVLIESMSGRTASERRMAAKEILELSFKSLEVGEFEERLKELEARMNAPDGPRPLKFEYGKQA